MNKRLIIIVVILLAIACSVFYLVSKDTNEDTDKKQTSTQTSEIIEVESDNENAETETEQYVNYSDELLANTTNTKIIFFHAPWCPQCRQIEKDIIASGVPSGVTILKADYDTSQELRQKYGVTIQTTLVKVDDQGNLIEKYVAYDEPTLESIKENLL